MNIPNIFTLSQWHRNQANSKAVADDCLVVETKTDDVVNAALSLQLTQRLGFKIAELSGEPIIQYNDLYSEAEPNLATFNQALTQKMHQKNVDLIYFHNVRHDSGLYQLLENTGIITMVKKAPYIDLSEMNGLDDYYKSLSAKTRKSRRRSLKKLEAQFNVEYVTIIDQDIDLDLVDQVIKLKKNQLERLGLSSRLFANEEKMQELEGIILAPNKPFKCIFSLLKCDDKIAAAEIGYLHQDVYYSFLGTMDEDFYSYSPGGCQLLKTIEWALQNHVKIFDLLAPEDDYKTSWAGEQSMMVYDIMLPFTAKGKLFGKLYYKSLRPMLKSVYLFIKSKTK